MNQKAKNWAKKHKISLWEPTRKIEGQKGFGYPSHPYRSHKSVKLTKGLDQQWKKDAKTLVRDKSSRSVSSRRSRRIDGSKCRLVSIAEILKAEKDPIEVVLQRESYKKMKRCQNRNHRARRGHKRNNLPLGEQP